MELDEATGPSRRQVIRRGALVAGAVVWTAPAVQSIAPAAFAQGSPACIGCLTGGGQILGGVCKDGKAADKISYGLGPICCPTHDPTEIQVTCHPAATGKKKGVTPTAQGYHFTLNDVVTCSKTGDPSPPKKTANCANRFTGTVYDDAGNKLSFDLIDNGEPGKNDVVTFTVTSPTNVVLLTGSGSLDHGNLQAHEHLGKPLDIECDC
jgi:hypothetical protein